jgi:hypothetical protein
LYLLASMVFSMQPRESENTTFRSPKIYQSVPSVPRAKIPSSKPTFDSYLHYALGICTLKPNCYNKNCQPEHNITTKGKFRVQQAEIALLDLQTRINVHQRNLLKLTWVFSERL